MAYTNRKTGQVYSDADIAKIFADNPKWTTMTADERRATGTYGMAQPGSGPLVSSQNTRPSTYTYVDEAAGGVNVVKEYQNRDYGLLNIKGDETNGFDARVRGGANNWDYVDGVPYYTDADGQPTTMIPTSSGITPTTGGGQSYTGTPPPPPLPDSPPPPGKGGGPPPPGGGGGQPPPGSVNWPVTPYGQGIGGAGWNAQQAGSFDAFRAPERPMARPAAPQVNSGKGGMNPGVYGNPMQAPAFGANTQANAPPIPGKGGAANQQTLPTAMSNQQMLVNILAGLRSEGT